jgi:hypothetical protein
MPDQKKIGAGHASAMWRAGLKEIGQTLQAFPGHGVHGVEEPGLAGNLTPQEIVASKGGDQQSYDAMLNNRAQQAPSHQPSQEIER